MKGFLNPKGGYKEFVRKLFSNRLALRGGFGVLALGIFGAILAVPRPAHAGFFDGLIEILMGAMLGISSVIFSIVMLIVGSLVYTVVWMMRYVVEFAINMSINFSYTSGPIFNAGWPVLRDLANMGLILILVGIGVGTMLNLKLNKSRLPMFFLVAILINLTPIITGVIIDFSNIIANVFFVSAKNALSAAVGNSPIDFLVKGGQSIINDTISEAISGNFTLVVLGNIIKPLLGIVVGLVLIFVFALLAALFLARIVALLILVILSPVAFLGLIFGGGKWKKTLWDNWWDNFIKWSIIVIPLIFFLWLGGIFFNASPDVCNPENQTVEDLGGVNDDLRQGLGFAEGEFDVFMCQTSITFFAVTAMVVGIMISFKSSAAGAGVVISKTKQLGAWAGKKTERRAYATGSRIRKSELGEKIAKRTSESRTGRAVGAYLKYMPGVAQATRAGTRAVRGRREQAMQDWKKVKDFNGWSDDAKLARIDSEVGEKKAKLLDDLSRSAPDKLAKKVDQMSDTERDKFVKLLTQMDRLYAGATSTLYRDVDPRLHAEQESQPIKKAQILAKEIKEATSSSFRNWASGTFTPEVVEAIIRAGKLNQAQSAAKDTPEKLDQLNAGLIHAANRRGLGATLADGSVMAPKPEEIRNMIRDIAPKTDVDDTSRPFLAAAIKSASKAEREGEEVISKLKFERSDIDRLSQAIGNAMKDAIKDARADGTTNEKTLRQKAYEGAEEAFKDNHENHVGTITDSKDYERFLEYLKESVSDKLKDDGEWPGN